MRSAHLIIAALIATSAASVSPAPASAAASTRTVSFRYSGTPETLAEALGRVFGVNIIVSSSGAARVPLVLQNATLDEALRAFASKFSPPLAVWHDGSTYYLTPQTDERSVVVTMPRLANANAAYVASKASGALSAFRATLVAVPQRNKLVYIGPASGYSIAKAAVDAFDQSGQCIEPIPCTDTFAPKWVPLMRMTPAEVPDYLKRAYGNSWDDLGVTVLPTSAQGGVYLSGPTANVAAVQMLLKNIDSKPVRQINVKVELYDVQPENRDARIGVLYGSNPSQQGGGNASFSPGSFFRSTLIPGVTSGIGAQIIAAINTGHGKLVQTADITMSVPDQLFGAASTTSESAGVGGGGQQRGTFGNAGGASSGVTAPVTPGGTASGAHHIQIGETDYITFSANGLTSSFQIEPIQSGVILDIEPDNVGADGLMHLTIDAQTSRIIGFVNGLPRFTTRSATTDSYVRSGQSIPFGGFVLDSDNYSETKVPFLGDIPLLGHFFRYEEHATSQERLVFIVTPTLQEF